MDKGSRSRSPREYIDFELEISEGGPREYPVAVRSLAGGAEALLQEFFYDSGRDEYLCLFSKTPLVRYLGLPQIVEQLPVMPPLRMLGMVVGPLGLGQLNIKREKRCMEEAIDVLAVR